MPNAPVHSITRPPSYVIALLTAKLQRGAVKGTALQIHYTQAGGFTGRAMLMIIVRLYVGRSGHPRRMVCPTQPV